MASKEDLKKALCYPINLNYIYMIDGGKDDPEYREVVKKYLLLYNKFFSMEEFCKRKNIKYSNPEYSFKIIKQMADYLLSDYPNYNSLYINTVEDIVCELNLLYDVPVEDTPFYNYFFSYRIIKSYNYEIDDFLNYHLTKSFNNDFEKYKSFLYLLPRDFPNLFINENITLTINEWIKKNNESFESLTGTKIDYTILHSKLINIYIKDISINDFNEVMNYKRLPNGKNKYNWIGNNNADAYRFSKQFNFKIKQMNDCFSFPNGKLKANDKPKDNRTQTELTKIFKNLIGVASIKVL